MRVYQRFAGGVPLVLGASEQQSPGQEVESLSSSLGAVVHLGLPQLELIEGGAAQEPATQHRSLHTLRATLLTAHAQSSTAHCTRSEQCCSPHTLRATLLTAHAQSNTAHCTRSEQRCSPHTLRATQLIAHAQSSTAHCTCSDRATQLRTRPRLRDEAAYLSREYMSSRLFWMGVPVTAHRAQAFSLHTAREVWTLGFLMLWASSRTTRAQDTRIRGAWSECWQGGNRM